MKKIKIIILLLLFIPTIGFPKTHLSKSKSVDSPFAIYNSDTSWRMQKEHLFNFAIALKRNPEMTGFIIYGSSKKYPLEKAKSRINRSIKFLTQDLSEEFRVEKSRIKVLYDGERETARIILQPIDEKSLPAKPKLPSN